jgi:transcriptional regulator of heat shock response
VIIILILTKDVSATNTTNIRIIRSKEIVLSCILANRTVNETIAIIDRRLNVKLAIDTIKHLRMKVRKEALEELQTMKTDNDTYLYQFLKTVDQTKKGNKGNLEFS